LICTNSAEREDFSDAEEWAMEEEAGIILVESRCTHENQQNSS